MQYLNKFLAALLVFALCGAPELLHAAQQTAPPTPQSQSPDAQAPPPSEQNSSADAAKNQPQQQNPPAQTGVNGTEVSPSQGQLEPVPSNSQTPDTSATPQSPTPEPESPGLAPEQTPAASPAQDNGGAPQSPQAQSLPEKPAPQKPAEPVGAATAEKGRTIGGAASKPAGTAIAPAKQRQVRSWLIRLGAIAAVGAAAGSIYALSRKTPSLPPGTAALRTAIPTH